MRLIVGNAYLSVALSSSKPVLSPVEGDLRVCVPYFYFTNYYASLEALEILIQALVQEKVSFFLFQ